MIFPILDEQGNIIAYAGHQRDITQRKKAEEELRRNSEELAFLLKTSQSFSTTLDLDSLLQIAINEAVNLSRLGTGVIYLLEGEMLRLKATTPPMPPQFPEELRIAPIADHPHIRQAITTRGPVIIDDTATADLTPAEQTVVQLRELRTLLYVPLLGEDNVWGVYIVGSVGEPCMISKAMINLNLTLANLAALAVQNAQFFKALKESQYDLLKSQEIAHLGHWKLDPKTGEVEGSEELFRIFGLSQKDASLEAFADVVHPDDRAYDLQHIQRGIDHGEPWNIEHRLLLKDGTLKWIRAIGEPSVNENGERNSSSRNTLCEKPSSITFHALP
jgi:PAS domain S-box-containing protein